MSPYQAMPMKIQSMAPIKSVAQTPLPIGLPSLSMPGSGLGGIPNRQKKFRSSSGGDTVISTAAVPQMLTINSKYCHNQYQ